MKTLNKKLSIKTFMVALTTFLFAGVSAANAQNNTKSKKMPAKNIVIVHGAFADGSGWKAVYDILKAHDYNVSIVQNPLTSLQDDVNATNSILDRQDGPTVLVGHSWGGMVITEAGIHPSVTSLVYVAAFAPAKGESAGYIESIVPLTEKAGFTKPDKYGLVYFEPAKFHSGFAHDVRPALSDFMCHSQAPIAGKCFDVKAENIAWKSKPSYGIVATEDEAISPVTERNMYNRAGASITELKGNHVIFMTRPKAVAKVIMEAAQGK